MSTLFSVCVPDIQHSINTVNGGAMAHSRLCVCMYTNVCFCVLNPLISIVPYKVYLPVSLLSIYLAYHSEGAKLLCKQCLNTR